MKSDSEGRKQVFMVKVISKEYPMATLETLFAQN